MSRFTGGNSGSIDQDASPECAITEIVTGLVVNVRQLIDSARARVATTINSEMTLLYWEIGTRIREDVLRHERAGYGEYVIKTLAQRLTGEYGRGFGRANLLNMIKFAETFPDTPIVQSLIGQLSWTHFLTLLPIKDRLKRHFYAEMCRLERWSVRTLRSRIAGMLYERTALSGKPESVIDANIALLRETDQFTPDLVFRDPYLLDFLGLADGYSESDLEYAIVREMKRFLLELGAGFSFVARQKRMKIDNEDFYLDLLFYHRKLQRLVAIELKLERFQAAHKGQMELYLRWLDRFEREPFENSPVGLILCSEKSPQQIELLQLEGRGDIHVAEYFTRQLPRPVLERQIGKAIRRAQDRLTKHHPPE